MISKIEMQRGKRKAKTMEESWSYTQSNVIVKQHRENELDTSFKPEPIAMIMKAKHGNGFIVDSNGVEYKRNVTHVKKFIVPSCRKNIASSPIAMSPVNLPSEVYVDPPIVTVESPEPQVPKTVSPELSTSRPQRTRRMPARFRDYEL